MLSARHDRACNQPDDDVPNDVITQAERNNSMY
jgi:hypothetical protein